MRFPRLLLHFLVLWALLAPTGHTAEPSLHAEVQPLTPSHREGAPLFLDIQLRHSGQGILEGALNLRVMANDQPLLKLQTQDLALLPGTTTQRVLLPPVHGEPLEVELSFSKTTGDQPLGRFPITSDRYFAKRQYLIAVCSTLVRDHAGLTRLGATLSPERYFTALMAGEAEFTSSRVWLTPEDLPAAAGLCAFDLVVLDGSALLALSDKQLAQLTTWLQAGGSVCVTSSGESGAAQLERWRTLAGGPGSLPAATLDPNGHVTLPSAAPWCRRAGLGRFVIAPEAPSSDVEMDSSDWIHAGRFLAHFKLAQLDVPRSDAGKNPASFEAPNRSYDRVAFLQAPLFDLLPKTSRMIPLPTLFGVLGVFVLLIGPGEWLLLGKLRRRFWTWFTFPLTAVVFTISTAQVAENYLGHDLKHTTLTVTDLGPGGKILRENSLELWIAGKRTEAALDQHQTLVSAQVQNRFHPRSTILEMPLYQGQFPGHYVLRQPLLQWQPRILRTLKFGSDASLPNLQWDAVDGPALHGLLDPRAYLEKTLQSSGWILATLVGTANQDSLVMSVSDDCPLPKNVLSLVSTWNDEKTGYLTGLSPSGQSDLRDLAVHDPSDPGECLVMAIQRSGTDIRILRRLYRTDE